MADQASLRFNNPAPAGRIGPSSPTTGSPAEGGNGSAPGPGDVVHNVAGLGEDLLSLAELQAHLATIELKQNAQAIQFGGAFILVGAVLGMGGLPIALAGIAELLVSGLGMQRGWALILVAVAAFVIAGTCVAIAVARIRAADLGFPLSREELARNMNWIRTVLLYSGRSARAPRR
jgi:hypothetical protein